MIIRKKTNSDNDENSASNYDRSQSGSAKIIKAGNNKPKNRSLKQRAIEKKEKALASEFNPEKEEKSNTAKEQQHKKTELEEKLEEFDKIDVTALEFKERYERRRGERRRGFRRIDERALVSRAQEEAQNIREIAAKEGYKNGLLEAGEEIENVKNALVDFVNAKNSIYDEISPHILEISLEIAKKIIKKEVELSNDVLKSVINEVLSELGSQEEKITIKVNPDDVDFAKASMPEILSNSTIEAKIVVVGDELVERGSCTVIANNGVIDANFSTQLAIIQNAFGIYQGGE